MSTLSRAVLRSALILGGVLAISILAARTLGPLGLFIAILLPLAAVPYVGRIFKDALYARTFEKLRTYKQMFEGSRFEVESVSRASPEEFRTDFWGGEEVEETADQSRWFVVGTFVVCPKASNTFWRPVFFTVVDSPPQAIDAGRRHETLADGGEGVSSGSQGAKDIADEDDDDESLPLDVYAVDRWDGSQWVKADMEMYGSTRLRLHVGMDSPLQVGYLTYFGCYLGETRFSEAG